MRTLLREENGKESKMGPVKKGKSKKLENEVERKKFQYRRLQKAVL